MTDHKFPCPDCGAAHDKDHSPCEGKEDERYSEFGDGFLYPLALFVAHAGDWRNTIGIYKQMAEEKPGLFGENKGAQMWLYAAADHLFGFRPKCAPTSELVVKAESIKERALTWRLPMTKEQEADAEQISQLIQDAKDLFFALDLHYGHEPVKGEWE